MAHEIEEHGGSRSEEDFHAKPKPYCSEVFDDDGHPTRTGSIWTAAAHIITAVIGSGVLSLAWSIAQLGWIAGPTVMLAFAYITYITSRYLADSYRHPGPEAGQRSYSYRDAVKHHLGGSHVWWCGLFQYTNLLGTAIGYTITSSLSMAAIQRSNCFHFRGEDHKCSAPNSYYMMGFGVIQVLLSQIPKFSKLSFLSILAAVMSFSYSGIGLGLGLAKAIQHGHALGTIGGVAVGHGLHEVSEAGKVWNGLAAIGNIAFAYAFSMVLIEIQDTLMAPPIAAPESKVMKKASMIGILTTTLFYMSVGCVGYAAFGNSSPGNLLTGFGFFEPFWLVDIANLCIVIHLVGAYQVYAQPLFAFMESWFKQKYSRKSLIHKSYKIKVLQYDLHVSILSLLFRTSFVVFTTFVAMLLPIFNSVMGLIGAMSFWPLTIYFPIKMHIKQHSISRWTTKWTLLQILSIVSFFISIAAAIGSIEGIVYALRRFKPFEIEN